LQPSSLEQIKDMPVIIVQGDADELVPVTNTRQWAEKLKELGMTYEYKEIPGGDHGGVINDGTPLIFEFFAKHSKSKKESSTSKLMPNGAQIDSAAQISESEQFAKSIAQSMSPQ